MQRIQKIIANSGYCSRRKAEDLIKNGKVILNDSIANIGDKAETSDEITINGKPIAKNQEKYYYILNKPKGILVTKDDPKHRRIIYNLKSLSKLKEKIGINLNYVGRLDAMSEGLLILTNDGELNNILTHPKHQIKKTYLIRTEPTINKNDILKLKNGLMIEDRKFYAKISNIKNNNFEITIQEGRNRIIRKAIEDTLKYKIYQLKRISTGTLKLGNLKSGDIGEIPEEEIKKLNSQNLI